MSKASVLLAHSVAKIGGAEKVTLDILQALSSNKHRALAGALEKGPFLDEARSLGVETIELKLTQPMRSTPLKNLKSISQGLRLIKKENIGLIHTGDIFIARSLLPIAAKSKVPMICHMHFPPDNAALQWVFSKYGKKVDITFLYCSQELMSACYDRLITFSPDAKHQVIHNGVNTDIFKKYPIVNDRILPEEKINIGIVANLQKRKGHDEFLKAAASLIKEDNRLQFHVIGGDLFGEKRELELKRLVETLNIIEHVTFHGQVKNVKPFLNELDIYVCASHEEAFPISILEAMAFGLAIVSTNVNGIPEALEHEVNSLLFKPKNIEQFTSCLRCLIKNENLRQRLGSNAKERLNMHFSSTIFSERIINMHHALLAKKYS